MSPGNTWAVSAGSPLSWCPTAPEGHSVNYRPKASRSSTWWGSLWTGRSTDFILGFSKLTLVTGSFYLNSNRLHSKGFSWRPKYLRSYNSTFIRLFVETVRVIYQLQWSQHIFAGFKVVQTGDDGAERSALTNAAQRCHHPVAVIMDVKCQTLLLQDATGTGSDTKLRVWAAVSHQRQWSEAAISPAEPVQAGSCPPSLWLSETKPSPECSLYSSPTAAPERITHTQSRTISSPSSAASVSITRLEPMT